MKLDTLLNRLFKNKWELPHDDYDLELLSDNQVGKPKLIILLRGKNNQVKLAFSNCEIYRVSSSLAHPDLQGFITLHKQDSLQLLKTDNSEYIDYVMKRAGGLVDEGTIEEYIIQLKGTVIQVVQFKNTNPKITIINKREVADGRME